jgi:hypothetical protein
MANFMKLNETEILNELRKAVLEILFEKVDGTNRLMKCTLQPSYFNKPIPTESERQDRANFLAQGETEPQKVRVIHVWDVDQSGWRSIRLDKIISIQLTSA